MTPTELVHIAKEARKMAYVPYSHFAVGAALVGKSGRIYTGCNVENAAYGPTNCAERTAFFKAVSEGEREFVELAVIGGKEHEPGDATPPCGVCRQVMLEFCGPEFMIYLGREDESYEPISLADMMPYAFRAEEHLK